MKIIVGSISERKIKSVEKIISQLMVKTGILEVVGCATKSGVPETPYGEQTFVGAHNRARNSMNGGDADLYIGLESGLVERYGHLYEEAWACVVEKDGKEYFGFSSGLKVPDYIVNKMKETNSEHCIVMEGLEKEFGKLPNDTWGTYSANLILREVSLEEALRNALIQAIAPEQSFYKKNK